jgi:glutamate-ammonia-ligase adenylyltransferase
VLRDNRADMNGSLASRIITAPVAFEPELARDALALAPAVDGPVRDLIAGVAGCSPYLAGLLRREAEWIAESMTQSPEAATEAVLASLYDLPATQHKSALRQAKRRMALLTALCDLGGVWSVSEVTAALTRLADTTLQVGLKGLVAAEIARGSLPGQTEADADEAAGMVVVAMGKMGAFELNYSSDIDLICLFDQERYGREDVMQARSVFIKITRRLMALLSDLTGDGYVFRTDLRLRPDPSVTPVCIAMDAAERYYESIGRGWERAAHIKARTSAGDLAAGDAYLERLTPFVWRKHLDFVALRESEEMRQRIRAHKGLTGALELENHDIKLGAGGIREIEFFTQTHQMISGGRDPSLRTRRTDEGLAAIAKAGWIKDAEAEALTRVYWAHRRVEHGVQMIQDAQTHHLPRDGEGMRRLACLLGEGDVGRFRSGLMERLRETASLTEAFFSPPENAPKTVTMRELPDRSLDVIAGWSRYPALRSSRAVEIFERLKPDLLARLDKAAHPEEALLQFDGFLSGLPAGVQLFAMFEARPQLIDLIVDICATAPALARYLSRNAAVFDAVIVGDFFAPWPGAEVLEADLSAVLTHAGGGIGDYERQLDAARRWRKEWHFRIGVHHLRGLISGAEAAAEYSDLADAVVRSVLPCVVEDFAARHGQPPGRGAVVVGMGSLGARRLTTTSDLDLIVIYDAAGEATSDGKRPLASAVYYARLTKSLVTALSAPMSEGIAYEVDMRLRPSGRQGPVATPMSGFASYQRTEAWAWEHLALTRARIVAVTSDKALGDEVLAVREEVLARPKDRRQVLSDVAEMRARLFAAKPGEGVWDAKAGPGKMTDIELLGQTGALLAGCDARDPEAQLDAGFEVGLVDAEALARLKTLLASLDTLNQAARLLGDKTLNMEQIGKGARQFLLRVMQTQDIEGLRDQTASGSKLAAHDVGFALETGNI